MIISPSILAADCLDLRAAASTAEVAGADWLHVDVMDGHFVPNLTFGLPVVKQLKAHTTLPLDVHLMITNPDAMALQYVDAGANFLSFHPETSFHPLRLLSAIRERGAYAGVALNPGTSLEVLWPLVHACDFVLVMSVNPGFAGQSFIASTVERVAEISARRALMGLSFLIEVDGGINTSTARLLPSADAFVCGAYFYQSAQPREALSQLRGLRQGKNNT